MDGYLVCPNPRCKATITRDDQYEFEDVHEDFEGRDVIAFKCLACGQHGESLAYRSPN